MEMKDAPLVQEEIASAPLSSKIQSLRKVAVTVAVVALTVCGVAIGMVAAGMEKKSVPTLKYTPGTTHTYTQTGAINFRGANAYEMESTIKVSVLSVDPVTGDATLLIEVPEVPESGTNPALDDAEAKTEGDETTGSVPRHLFTIVQGKNGQFYKDTLMGSIADGPVIPALEDFLELMAPRLAADATVAEVDRVSEAEVDAKYSVNALSNGETEVTRAFTSANMHGATQQHAEATVATIKDGEITSVKKAASHEYSVNQGPAVDGRFMVDAPVQIVRTNVENVDLSKYAAELEKMFSIGVLTEVSPDMKSDRKVWDNDMEVLMQQSSNDDDAFGTEDGDRKLLQQKYEGTWTIAKWDRWQLGLSGKLEKGGSGNYRCEGCGVTCFVSRKAEIKIIVTALDVANHDVSAWLKFAKKTESAATSGASANNSPKVEKSFGVDILKENTSTTKASITLYKWGGFKCISSCENAGIGGTRANPWEKSYWTHSIPVPYVSAFGYGLQIKFGAGIGVDFKPKCQVDFGSETNSKGPNFSGCSKAKNTFGLWLCYAVAASTVGTAYVFWGSARHTWNAFQQRSLKASCAVSSSGSMKVMGDAGLATGCLPAIRKIKFGITVTGHIIKVTVEACATLSYESCIEITKAVENFSVTITAYGKQYYGFRCKKHKTFTDYRSGWRRTLGNAIASISWSKTYGNQFVVLKYISKNRNFQDVKSSTQSKKLSSFYGNTVGRALDAARSACKKVRHISYNTNWQANRSWGCYNTF
jgi:hypothetical protein